MTDTCIRQLPHRIIIASPCVDLKIKDAAKAFGKKFSSGASISETATGEKEVTIQGDCSHDLPAYLIKEFKVLAVCTHLAAWRCDAVCRWRPRAYS